MEAAPLRARGLGHDQEAMASGGQPFERGNCKLGRAEIGDAQYPARAGQPAVPSAAIESSWRLISWRFRLDRRSMNRIPSR